MKAVSLFAGVGGFDLALSLEGVDVVAAVEIDRHARTVLILENDRLRRLTPMECERLQGFPDNWTAGLHDTVRYEQMGNAVSVPVARWIIRRLLDLGE
jgi:site-specific DNA-cytosine methylase